MPRPAEMTRSGRPVLLLATLYVGAAAISAFTILREIDPFDEGLMLQAARRIADGQTPYADFPWPYGPAQPYLLAATFEAFGESLLGWRVLRSAVDAGVAVAAFVLVRGEAGTRWGVIAWLVTALAMAQPTGPNPWAPALLVTLPALVVAAGARPVAAGVLVGAAAAFRLDFGVYAGVAAAVALLLALPPGARRGGAIGFAGATAAATLLVYLPWLVAAGPGDVWDSLVATALRDSDYWSLPFPLAFDEAFRAWPPRALGEDLKDLLGFYVPLILLAGLALAAAAAWRRARERRPPAAVGGLLALAAGYTAYLLSRTDEFHTTPLLVALACALCLSLARTERRPEAVLLGAVLALLLAYGAANRLSALLLPPDLEPIDAPAADGVRTRPAEAAALSQVVALVRRSVPPGDPIYVAPARSDLVRIGNPLLYVLTGRDNADSRDFGLLARAGEQRRTVTELERERPRLVVRWTDPASTEREPNLRGRSSGVRLLDRWIADHYRLERRVGHYDVLVARP